MVLVDGFIASAAALAAVRLAPEIAPTLVFAHRSAEAGHGALLDALAAEPLLALDMRLGEGTGALLAWPILRAAAAMLRDMATFESAGIDRA
jgi:nicotinate-nucleotide--dimethylbenzimidazole phosphoribosyltransferase